MTTLNDFLNDVLKEAADDFYNRNNITTEERHIEILFESGFKEDYLQYYLKQANVNNIMFLNKIEVEFLNTYINEYEESEENYLPFGLYLNLNYEQNEIQDKLKYYTYNQIFTSARNIIDNIAKEYDNE